MSQPATTKSTTEWKESKNSRGRSVHQAQLNDLVTLEVVEGGDGSFSAACMPQGSGALALHRGGILSLDEAQKIARDFGVQHLAYTLEAVVSLAEAEQLFQPFAVQRRRQLFEQQGART